MDDTIETNADSNPNPNRQMNLFSGEQLRDAGMKKALDHAEAVIEDWSETAFRFIQNYNPGVPFMCEDARADSAGIVPVPPTLWAWGGIIRRAAKAGIITKVDSAPVKNPRAHCANVAVWIKTNGS